MVVRFLYNHDDLYCKICNQKMTNLNHLGMHVRKHHDISSTEYSIKYIFENNLPKCRCGCGKDVVITKFQYHEYTVGHNPKCHWQTTYDKDSVEFKIRSDSVSQSLKEYYSKNEKIVTDETKKILSINRKKYILENPEIFQSWIDKMKKTKQRQAESGILKQNNYYRTKTDDEIHQANEKRKNTRDSWDDFKKSEVSDKITIGLKRYWNNLSEEEQKSLIERRLDGQRNVSPELRQEKASRHKDWIIKTLLETPEVLNFRPLYNKSTIPYIEDILNVKYDTNFRHALYKDGEFRIYDPILNRFYYADAYCEKQNIWIEFDEPNKFKSNELTNEHILREQRIRDILDCMFLRIYFDKKIHG